MEEIDLKELLNIFWRRKIQIILIIAMFIVIGIVYTLGFVTPKYQSTTKLLLATNSSSQSTDAGMITTTDVTLNSKLVATYSELVKSNRIIRTVISNLALDTDESVIRNNVTVSAVQDTEVIEIKVKSEEPVLAAKIANEIAKVFIENIKEFYGIENVHVVDDAEVAEQPANINHVKDIIIFVFIGIVVSSIYVFIANMLDTTVKSPEDIEKITDLRIIATIPLYSMQEGKKNKGGKR